MSFLGDLSAVGINAGLSLVGNEIAAETGRKNLDYAMSRYYSPQAQVRNLAAAGINPAVAFGNQSPVFSSGGQVQMPTNPLAGIGTTSLSDLANYMNAKTNAKKAGVEMQNLDVERQAKQFDLDLAKIYKSPQEFAALTMAWKNVMLADDEHSINEWKKAKEKALSEVEEKNRDLLEKTLGNMDTQIKLENQQREEDIKLTQEKQKTEKTSQSANIAAANASNTQASVNREMARYQRVIADVEESASPFKLENLLRHYAAVNMISDADYQEAYRRYKRLASINADNDKHSWNQALDSFMFYLEEHVKGLSPFVSAASTNYSTK